MSDSSNTVFCGVTFEWNRGSATHNDWVHLGSAPEQGKVVLTCSDGSSDRFEPSEIPRLLDTLGAPASVVRVSLEMAENILAHASREDFYEPLETASDV